MVKKGMVTDLQTEGMKTRWDIYLNFYINYLKKATKLSSL